MTFKLFPHIPPNTLQNFLTHSKNPYYHPLTFHRIINHFILQPPHPTPTPIPPQTIYPTPFQHQFSLQPFNLYPPLSIPNPPPNTNPSQFFILQINQLPQNILTQLPHPPSPQPILQPYPQKPPTPSL
ncbi:peptidylprolyl isomerase, partial [Staphylococcus epidermidis]|uniref:peptidylprolyl isomerase n=1 Tax=Staphylococcus epidermidis TaxID=1282 RepID=UPI0037D9B2D8